MKVADKAPISPTSSTRQLGAQRANQTSSERQKYVKIGSKEKTMSVTERSLRRFSIVIFFFFFFFLKGGGGLLSFRYLCFSRKAQSYV